MSITLYLKRALMGMAVLVPLLLSGGFAGATEKSISQGRAETVMDHVGDCRQGRPTALGKVTALDGKIYHVPAQITYSAETTAPDLYNGCTGVTPRSISDVNLETVPIREIDPDGDVVTGLLFGDNYFELFVNGRRVGGDAIPFTPFNSSIVRFSVKRPYVIAVKLVDWEENLGLGSEQNRGTRYHPGDGGFVARFSDGTQTDNSWKAYPYYISPIADLNAARSIDDLSRDTSRLTSDDLGCDEVCFAVHYPVPEAWNRRAFDDSHWPRATEFTNQTVGVRNKPAYMNFKDQFIDKGARFIWSPNLVTDNLVLVRKIVN